MTLLRSVWRPTATVPRLNPVTAIGAVLVIDLALLVRIDVPSAVAALVLEVVLVPLAGIRIRPLVRRATPVLITSALTGVAIALYGTASGEVLLRWGFVQVTRGSIVLGVAASLRLLAIALPAVVLLAELDATRLADALVQRLHLPARFVLAALAAVRLVGVLRQDWRTLALARRARGMGDGSRLRRLPAAAFALLVLALRRAADLATAMEARGLGAPGPRSSARRSRFGGADAVVLVLALLIAVVSVGAGLVCGGARG